MYILIVGAGKVGWNLARELIQKGNEVTVVESDPARYATVEEELEHAVQYGDGSELWVLERGGIERAEMVIAVTGDDEDNILICQVAREKYGVERVISRCNNPRNRSSPRSRGASRPRSPRPPSAGLWPTARSTSC
jgi:trk system potassium uptake protein TrkA